eukprot:TRINITY_DN428_c0_g2_i2.p2 TRINITY_DN428_c0_g2~~TRINITY_DN428_c0_g2_i2.p2  ORF type:complete len:223 (+),score=12.21 TRINITY_DN428_c0_g2_i2:110-778(+)
MGCRYLLLCQSSPDVPYQQLFLELSNVLLTVQAQKRRDKNGNWEEKVTLLRQKQIQQTYDGSKSIQGTLEDVYICELSMDQKHLYFVKKGLAPQVIVSDLCMRQIFYDRLYYRNHIFMRIEGDRYNLGDYQIALGIAKTREADEKVLGVILQIEYLPIQHLEQAQDMLGELIGMIEGMLQQQFSEHAIHLENMQPTYQSFGLSLQYSNLHYAVQMCQLMASV